MERSINRNAIPVDPLEGYEPRLFPRLTRVAGAVIGFFNMHQLASHGDHLPSGVDEMLLGDQMMLDYWGEGFVGQSDEAS